MKKYILSIAILATVITFFSCSDQDDNQSTDTDEPKLIFKFKFDSNQVRLNNIGEPATIPAGNAGQTPVFNTISSHYLELAQTDYTALGNGWILYRAPETTIGGDLAIDFSQSKIVSENEVFLEIPISQVHAGTYKWVRCSLSYQNYQIKVLQQGTEYNGTLASFVGFNSYINTFNIGNNIFTINANKPQGFWAFALNDHPFSTSGQAPAGATTVPNPNAGNSPIPAGSCVVTGSFQQPLTISDSETQDVVVTLSLSINKSFEWRELNADGKYEPAIGESVVDMGLRGLIPSYTR